MKNPLDTTFDHRNPYKVLGVAADAAPAAIRKAYLALAKRNHPNLFATDPEKYRSSTALMQNINAAYELLSDPTRRQLWDRRHPVTLRPGSRPAPRPAPAPSPHYDSDTAYVSSQMHMVIRKYNEFVGSLRTAAQRQDAARKIRRFQESPEGADYIRKLVASLYQHVFDLIDQDRRVDKPISVYDDGLVEIMFLYEGALEVSPSEVFITYAYLVHRENGGRIPAAPGKGRRQRRGPGTEDARAPVLRLRHDASPAAPTPAPAKDVGARLWHWLMSKPEPRHR